MASIEFVRVSGWNCLGDFSLSEFGNSESKVSSAVTMIRDVQYFSKKL